MSAISRRRDPVGTYNIDPSHSNVGFAVRHMGIATVRGAFKKFEGTVDANGGALKLAAPSRRSVDTGDANRDGHLQSPDFFDAPSSRRSPSTRPASEPAPTASSS